MGNSRKYIILLGDGMADYPVDSLNGKTPLEHAHTPNMDSLASQGIAGMARTVPAGMAPGSDTANLSIFGYDPKVYYTGRAPLEALNMGIDLGPDDVAFRCNIVSIEDGKMNDFTADHIDTEFTRIVIAELDDNNRRRQIEFHPGVSYRNIVIWRGYPYNNVTDTTPPHDITGREVEEHLPGGDGADLLREIMAESREIIRNSKKIQSAGTSYRGTPESVWLWGGGGRPTMKNMKERFGFDGYTISAVDLIHGIGRAAGLEPILVPGATGYIDTDYRGKAEALLRGIRERDFVYLHVESPDESGHEGNLEHKLKSIEDFDRLVVGTVMDGLEPYSNYAVLVMPDHPTPLSIMTHTDEPVPFAMVRTGGWNKDFGGIKNSSAFSERAMAETGLFIDEGHRLLELMINGAL